jgi:small subunit ribosomal protein S6
LKGEEAVQKPKDKRVYELMYVTEPTVASTQWATIVQEVESVLTRHGGKILRMRKWEERKLAYPIKKKTRGTYLLVYLEAPPSAVSLIRVDHRLSENILRFLILEHPRRLPEEGREFRGEIARMPTPTPEPAPVQPVVAP